MADERAFKAVIVEDHVLFRETLARVLRSRFPRIQVIETGCLDEARRRIRDHAPQLVFLDIGLPDGNGLDLAKELKEQAGDITVAICSNHDLPQYREAARRCGVVCFLSKTSLHGDAVAEVVEGALARFRA